MNERKLSNFCTAMLAFSILVRLLLATGAQARTAPEEMPQTAPEEAAQVAVQHVRMSDAPQPDAAVTGRDPSPPDVNVEQAEAAAQPLTFSPAEAEAISISGGCTYPVDRQALLLRPSQLDVSREGPKVLIVHTHSSEAYTQEAGFTYTESDPLRTGDAAYSVIRVGDEIAAALAARGIETLHETALNDYPSYDGAYARMEETIRGYLAQYPSIQLVLDVHRDAALNTDGSQLDFSCTLPDGARCAQVMLVVGTDEGGLYHPEWEENLANALKLQALLMRQTDGLCRSIDLRTERFNQHLTHGSLLAEFGAAGNTLSEALRAAQLFGAALGELIEGLAAEQAVK